MTYAAKVVVWAFFLLIPTKFLEYFALHGSPIRPYQVYAVLIVMAAIVVAAHVKRHGFPTIPRSELAFFGIIVVLALLILVSLGGHEDFSLRIAVWPLANLLMGATLFYFARFMGLGSTIVAAAFGALVVQLLGIFADLWMPGTFAEWAARPAGLPQNSNNAALLVCFLLALLLPEKRGQSVSIFALYALVVSAPLVLVTLSLSGRIIYLAVAALFLVALASSPIRQTLRRPASQAVFTSIILAAFAGTLFFAPTLREPDTIAIWRARLGFAVPDILPARGAAFAALSPVAATPTAVPTPPALSTTASQTSIDESIRESDDTFRQRSNAAGFFWAEGLRHPLVGLGTGYSYLFQRGPHNTFLSLFVEQGVFAVILFFSVLLLLTLIAIRRQAIALLAITTIGWAGSMVSHTLLVEPWFIVFACAALGLTALPKSS